MGATEPVTARVRVRSFVVAAASKFPPQFNAVVAYADGDGGRVPLYLDDLRAMLDGTPSLPRTPLRSVPSDRNPGPDEEG